MLLPLETLLEQHVDQLLPPLLEELAFADAWPIGLAPEGAVFSCACDFEAPWEWSLVLEGEKRCLYDLAAGFHSLPDAHMDDLFAEEFLLELVSRFAGHLQANVPEAPVPGVAYPRRFPMQCPSWERYFAVNEDGGWLRLGLVPPV
jgi:hypothetical protein